MSLGMYAVSQSSYVSPSGCSLLKVAFLVICLSVCRLEVLFVDEVFNSWPMKHSGIGLRQHILSIPEAIMIHHKHSCLIRGHGMPCRQHCAAL